MEFVHTTEGYIPAARSTASSTRERDDAAMIACERPGYTNNFPA